MEILAGVAVDHSTWDDKLTTSDDYVDVLCHWPYSSSPSSSYWNCECLGGKTLYFTATTNNLLVKILGSLDEGVTFPITVESEFSVAVGTPVLKPIGVYFNALKIQVKPAVAGVHGTLSVIGSGSSLPGATGIELAGDLPDTAANDLAHIHANTDNLNIGDQVKAASISVTPATDITDGRYIGNVKVDSSALPTGAATEQGLDDILAKLSSDPATQTTLAAILAKIITAPATEAKQTALEALLGEVQASPTSNTVLDRLKALLTGIQLAAGTNLVGKVGIDQATANANEVVVKSINAGPLPDTNASDLAGIHANTECATAIDEHNETLTVVDTQYSYSIPANCKHIEFWSRNGYPVRFSFVTGKVATPTEPYMTLKSNCSYASPPSLNLSSKTLYLASDNAGDVVEILAWS